MVVPALPGQRGADDCVEIRMVRTPAEPSPGEGGIGHELRRVARPPRRFPKRHRPAGNPLDRRDDLAYGTSLAGSEVEGAALAARGEVPEGPHMRIREIGDVNVVAARGAVRRRI